MRTLQPQRFRVTSCVMNCNYFNANSLPLPITVLINDLNMKLKIFILIFSFLLCGQVFSQNQKEGGGPDISINPILIDEELESGQSSTQHLTIFNNGNSGLIFGISAVLSSQSEITVPKNKSNNVLILRDNLAWNLDVNVPLLEGLGVSISIASSEEMATLDFSSFNLIIFESHQPTAFYNRYQSNINRFEDYLIAGGNIEFHSATKPGQRIPNLTFPAGVQTLSTTSHNTYNYIDETSHPMLVNIPETLYGNTVSHEAFKSVPFGADTLTVNKSGQPTTIVYDFGEGRVLITGMSWEIGYNAEWNFATMLPNAFQYMLGLSGNLGWLSWNPVEGTVAPDTSQTIDVSFDASNLYPGAYSADILISNNNPDEPLLTVPVSLTVTGPNPPTSLSAMLDESTGEVELSWDFEFKDEFLRFKVYRNGMVLDSTTATSYMDLLPSPGDYSYELNAVYEEGESMSVGPVDIHWGGLPEISLSPLFIEEEIQSGNVLSKNLIISNDGDNELSWNSALQNEETRLGGGNQKYQTSLLTQDEIQEIILGNEAFKRNHNITGNSFDEVINAHKGSSRDIILVCVVDGGNFSAETWDYLNIHWAEYGNQELLIDYSSLSEIEITQTALSNSSANVLMIDNNWNAEEEYGALSQTECQAIAQYVDEGAGLFITGGTFNESQFADLEYQTQYFAPLVGIDPEAGFSWNYGLSRATNLIAPSHPIFHKLSNPYGNSIYGTSCHPQGNDWLTAITDGDLLAISENNQTAIIGYENRVYHSSAPMLVADSENIQFTYNVLSYCATGYDPLDWLAVSPHFGTILPGTSDTINVSLGNPNLYPNVYSANISITSNDPGEGLINIPVSLTVTGLVPPTNLTASLDILTGGVDLAWDFQNIDELLYFNIYRNGSLVDTSINPFCTLFLPAAGTYFFEITALFAAGESASAPPVEVNWEGKADISLEPDFFEEHLGMGQNSTKQLTIANKGEGNLNWAIDIFELNRGFNPLERGAGGPDTFGYSWVDSDQPGGPGYEWFDISALGNNTGLVGDESFVELSLPFDFEFYGEIKNEVKISTNGYLTFGSATNKYNNDPIPLESEPNDIIAPFWDDLMQGDSGVNYAYFDEANNRFIIQYSNWAKYNAPGQANFQVQLYQNGNIYFYYQELDCYLDQSTIGIENADGSDGLLIEINGDYLHEFMAIKVFSILSWINASQFSGSVSTGKNEVVDISFNAGELDPGDYFANLLITNNGPEEPLLTMPVSLSVTSEILPINLSATLNEETGDVYLYWDFQFSDEFLWFTIYRDGATLDTSTSPNYFDLLPGAGTYQYQVSAVNISGETMPSSFAEVTWEGMADISVEPGFLTEYLGTGQSTSRLLSISNSGEGKLEWALDIFQTEGKGGPDNFGYTWIDSDEPGGPEYEWMDISSIGTNTLLTGDDEYVTLILPFDFEFYGQVKNEVLVSTNGYLTFGYDGTDHSNDPIPFDEYPNDIIAPFWSDLISGEAGANYSYYDAANNRFIIQYSNWQKYNGIGEATFQVHLHQNGSMFFYYENLDCSLNEASIGIENMDGSDGLEIVYNNDYLHNQLAVKIASTPSWISPGQYSGIINSGESQDVDIYFYATGLSIGNYLAEITISSDDPDEPLLIIPVSLTVGDVQIEEHTINLMAGWTGISSYLEAAFVNIETISGDISGQVQMIQNMEAFYQPGNSNSTLHNWDVHSGYFIKVNETTDLVIKGNPLQNRSIQIVEGWNLIPVLTEGPIGVESLFLSNLEKIEIIKDAVGMEMFWPDKDIGTLSELKPGSAYLVKASGGFLLTY